MSTNRSWRERNLKFRLRLFLIVIAVHILCCFGFPARRSILATKHSDRKYCENLGKTSRFAAPRRLIENVEGPLYVNEKCINCAACAMFAPSVFSRDSSFHKVHNQPKSEKDILDARAALAACPVAAIRTESNAQRSHRGMKEEELLSVEEERLASQLAINPKFNGRMHPFPMQVSESTDDVFFIGHHSDKTFGAAPYLLRTKQHGWILVDTPKFSKSAVRTVEKLTGVGGPSFMFLTHVDDTTGHNSWKEYYPHMKRIFHSGDLGRHNWLGDKTLEDVEILLHEKSTPENLQFFDLAGKAISSYENQEVVIIHTPGHSPGSICLWRRPESASNGIIFTGDTYSYSTRDGGHMSSFPRYCNNPSLQSKILPLLAELEWSLVVPGHGHVKEYDSGQDRRLDMQPAIDELQ